MDTEFAFRFWIETNGANGFPQMVAEVWRVVDGVRFPPHRLYGTAAEKALDLAKLTYESLGSRAKLESILHTRRAA